MSGGYGDCDCGLRWWWGRLPRGTWDQEDGMMGKWGVNGEVDHGEGVKTQDGPRQVKTRPGTVALLHTDPQSKSKFESKS